MVVYMWTIMPCDLKIFSKISLLYQFHITNNKAECQPKRTVHPLHKKLKVSTQVKKYANPALCAVA